VPPNSQSSSSLASTASNFNRLLHEFVVVPNSQRASVESSAGDRPASQSRCSSPLMSDGDDSIRDADFDIDAEVEQEEWYHRRYGPSSDDSAGDDSDDDVVPSLPPASPVRKRPRYRQLPPSRPGAAEPVVHPLRTCGRPRRSDLGNKKPETALQIGREVRRILNDILAGEPYHPRLI